MYRSRVGAPSSGELLSFSGLNMGGTSMSCRHQAKRTPHFVEPKYDYGERKCGLSMTLSMIAHCWLTAVQRWAVTAWRALLHACPLAACLVSGKAGSAEPIANSLHPTSLPTIITTPHHTTGAHLGWVVA